MKILVTGHQGYIGSVLVPLLIDKGHTVTGLDAGFFSACLLYPSSDANIRTIQKDIRAVTAEDVQGQDAIIHLAGLSNDPLGEINQGLTREINYAATVNLATLAKKTAVRRFVFSSSCSVYGVSEKGEPINEQGTLNPITEYAKSKINAENAILPLATKDFSPVFLRNATVYGPSPRLRVDLVVNNLTGWAHTTGKICIMSDGTPWRPLIHIQDVCSAFIAAIEAPQHLVHCKIFNVGRNIENYQVRDIANLVKQIYPQCSIAYTGEHELDSRTYKVDFSYFGQNLDPYAKLNHTLTAGISNLRERYTTSKFSWDMFQGAQFTRLKWIKKLLQEGTINSSLFFVNRK